MRNRGSLLLVLLLLLGAEKTAFAEEPEIDLDLSFADDDSKAKDTSNQGLLGVAANGPDKNMDYGGIYSQTQLADLPKAVRPQALGARGYRSNLVAAGYGERTPGGGIWTEYNHNRVGWGLAAAANREHNTWNQFFHGYATYRILPFAYSPYFHLGAGTSSRGANRFGLLAGAGVEGQIYYGLTFYAGYTYFSAVDKGFPGGGVAWAF